MPGRGYRPPPAPPPHALPPPAGPTVCVPQPRWPLFSTTRPVVPWGLDCSLCLGGGPAHGLHVASCIRSAPHHLPRGAPPDHQLSVEEVVQSGMVSACSSVVCSVLCWNVSQWVVGTAGGGAASRPEPGGRALGTGRARVSGAQTKPGTGSACLLALRFSEPGFLICRMEIMMLPSAGA